MKGMLPVLYREYRFRVSNITFLFWDIFVPITYLLIFGYGFQRSLGDSFIGTGYKTDYASFFLPGILTMTCFSVAMNTSWRFFTERENGIFYELLTYPISRQDFVIGKILFNIVLSATGCLLAIFSGILLLDLKVKLEWLHWSLLSVGIGTAGWFFFFATAALRLHRIDSFNTFTSVCYILLMFASSLFYPLENLPVWFRAIARSNPLTWQTDMQRYLSLGVGDGTLLLAESFAFLGFMVISFFAAVRAVNRAAE